MKVWLYRNYLWPYNLDRAKVSGLKAEADSKLYTLSYTDAICLGHMAPSARIQQFSHPKIDASSAHSQSDRKDRKLPAQFLGCVLTMLWFTQAIQAWKNKKGGESKVPQKIWRLHNIVYGVMLNVASGLKFKYSCLLWSNRQISNHRNRFYVIGHTVKCIAENCREC